MSVRERSSWTSDSKHRCKKSGSKVGSKERSQSDQKAAQPQEGATGCRYARIDGVAYGPKGRRECSPVLMLLLLPDAREAKVYYSYH